MLTPQPAFAPIRHERGMPVPVRTRPVVLVALLVAAMTLIACGGDDKDDPAVAITTPDSTAATSTTAPSGTSATAGEFPQPKEGVLLDRLVVSKVRMDAPVETRGLNARGEMEDPEGKDAVAWYDFTEFPGFGGNAVFSGHVDWFTGELGVFGRVKELKDGDEIQIQLSDGMAMTYKVVSSILYESAKAPVEEIVGPTEKDSLTFITCEGTFDRSAQDYSHRRIVRAERAS